MNVIITTIKKKNYDFLDQRKVDFDLDYDDFKRAIQDLHVIQNSFKLKFLIIIKLNCIGRNFIIYRQSVQQNLQYPTRTSYG